MEYSSYQFLTCLVFHVQIRGKSILLVKSHCALFSLQGTYWGLIFYHLLFIDCFLQKWMYWGFPGGPVVKNLPCFHPWSGKIPHDSGQPSPCATATEPEHVGPRSCNQWSLCTLEPVLHKRSHRSEKPAHLNWVAPAYRTRESPLEATKTQHSQKSMK